MKAILLVHHEEDRRVSTFANHTHKLEVIEVYLLGVLFAFILNDLYDLLLFYFILLLDQLYFQIERILRQAMPLLLRVFRLQTVSIRRIVRIPVNKVSFEFYRNVKRLLRMMHFECWLPHFIAVKEGYDVHWYVDL